MTAWKSVAPGIRVREHKTRRHGARADRYYTLRLTVNGKQVEEALGWASRGWTLGRAQEELGKLREAGRTGQGAATLRDRRQLLREAEAHKRHANRTVADLWDRYSKDVLAHNKESTVGQKVRMYRSRIEPAIGKLPINDIAEEDCAAIVRGVLRLDDGGRIVSGRAEAGNVYRLLHHLFAKALGWKLRLRELGNPLENVQEPKAPRRERLLTDGEITALLHALDAAQEAPQIVAVIRAVVLTGARIGELLGLRWEDIRPDEPALYLHDTKTGFSRRPISAEALTLLQSVERVPGSPYVFRSLLSAVRPLPYDTVRKVFDRIAEAAGVADISMHSLRHWFSTMTANAVSNPRVGMALTGHRSTQAYLGYVHGHREQAQALAGELGALVTRLANAKSSVVAMPKAPAED